MKPAPRPGDFLLDRYFKDADAGTRERAREAFREFGRVLAELGDTASATTGDSHESPQCDTIPPTPEVTP